MDDANQRLYAYGNLAAFEDTWTWGPEEEEHLASLDSGASTRVLGNIDRVARQIDGPRTQVNLGAYPVMQGYSSEDLLAHNPLTLPLHRLRDGARLVA